MPPTQELCFPDPSHPAWHGQLSRPDLVLWLREETASQNLPIFLTFSTSGSQMSTDPSTHPNVFPSGKHLHVPWHRYSLLNTFRTGQLQQALKLLSQVVSLEICLHCLLEKNGGQLGAQATYTKCIFHQKRDEAQPVCTLI